MRSGRTTGGGGVTRDEIFAALGIRPEEYRDLHVLRNFSSFVAVSDGRVIAMTDPWMRHCPLFEMFQGRTDGVSVEELRDRIRAAVEDKIARFGMFAARRQLIRDDVAVPYGASEMMMVALRRGGLDAAVTVCDGAGTVVAANPDLVQGIGARMNGLFYTTPLPEVIEGIGRHGGTVAFPESAAVDQLAGLRLAVSQGHRRIAVTVNGFLDEPLDRYAAVAQELGVMAVLIVVCTTGVTEERAAEIAACADLVWSCGSGPVRERAGARAILQIAQTIPVFVMTRAGLEFASCYATPPEALHDLDPDRQYIIASRIPGAPVHMVPGDAFLSEARLPVRSANEPR
jgi:putative methanogenesis marker protein 8